MAAGRDAGIVIDKIDRFIERSTGIRVTGTAADAPAPPVVHQDDFMVRSV